jgi:regulator of sigma E protease
VNDPTVQAVVPQSDDVESTQTIGDWFRANAITLAIVAMAVGFALWKGWDFLLIGKVIVGLGFVVFIHELGHFLAAKWCDVHVETFSIGFGPALPGCSFRRGETRYMVALFPLGGYVKMVGEGSDSEDGEDDPRSFNNKTVGQRMLIISAGVIMNVILAAICYVAVFMSAGVERTAGVVGIVDSGSPAWQEGLRSGAVLTKVGTISNPYFNIDIMPEVMHWPTGVPMPIHYEFDGKLIETTVTPKKFDGPGRQMIGIGQPFSTRLLNANRLNVPPFLPASAASRSTPSLENGDLIVATTDPDKLESLLPLPPDPHSNQPNRYDYFEFSRRMQRLAGRDVTLLVRRGGESNPSGETTITVPAAFHSQTGLVMQIGPIAAVRRGSPADRAGVQSRVDGKETGDILEAVEVDGENGVRIRYALSKPAKPNDQIEERVLDPIRLPFELRQWAASKSTGTKTLKLTLVRTVGHEERKEVQVNVEWDDSWRYDRSAPSGEDSPLAIDEIGLAYQVTNVIRDVIPGSPAAVAGLRSLDVIKEVGMFDLTQEDRTEPADWRKVELTQWANTHWLLQIGGDLRRLAVKYQRDRAGEIRRADLDCTSDTTWPLVERGFRFDFDTRLQKADGFFEAIAMGGRDTVRLIGVIYNNLFAMLTNKVSFKKNASGPIMIAAVAYDFAGRNFPEFILFLGMISINLAVINFLPIPMLDGGHMAFLLYEKLRGKPAPEQLRLAATFVGVALIVSLMVFVTYLDIKRF